MLEVSHNSTAIARGCWKKYYWTYIEQLQPKVVSRSLTLGRIIHEAFEKFYTGTSSAYVLDFIQQSYDKELATASADEAESILTDKYTVMGMWAFYPFKDLSEFTENYPELEFKVPLRRGVRFVGRVDGLVKKDNVWWVREVKTTGLSPRQFEGRMNTSSQATGYVYALKKMGYDVKGVMYDCIKKPLLRKRQNESCDDFGKRLMADYLQDSKAPQNERKAYLRHYEYRPNYVIDQWLESQKDLVLDIKRKRKHGGWIRNMDQCWNFNSLCPFARICHMEKPDDLTIKLYYDRKEEENAKENVGHTRVTGKDGEEDNT